MKPKNGNDAFEYLFARKDVAKTDNGSLTFTAEWLGELTICLLSNTILLSFFLALIIIVEKVAWTTSIYDGYRVAAHAFAFVVGIPSAVQVLATTSSTSNTCSNGACRAATS